MVIDKKSSGLVPCGMKRCSDLVVLQYSETIINFDIEFINLWTVVCGPYAIIKGLIKCAGISVLQ